MICYGELLIERSRDPEHDAARALLAKGISGKLTLLDGKTGSPRTIINIEKAAKVTVEDNRTTGPRYRNWASFALRTSQTGSGQPPSPERDAA